MKKIIFESKRLSKLSGINENISDDTVNDTMFGGDDEDESSDEQDVMSSEQDSQIAPALENVYGAGELPDLSQDEKAFKTSKRPIPIEFRYSKSDGWIETKEGSVPAAKGDAIMTGVEGEKWPIQAATFATTYTDLKDGTAVPSRVSPVWAKEMTEPFQVKVSWGDALLQGSPYDYLVQYGVGDYGAVGASIFQKSYNQKQENQEQENQEQDLQEDKMKITRSQLKQLIKEELSRAMSARDALAASHNQNRVNAIKTNKSVTNAVSRPQAGGAYGPDEDYHNAYNEWSEHSALLDRFKLETGLDPDDSPDEFFTWIRGQEKESLSYLDTDKRYSGI